MRAPPRKIECDFPIDDASNENNFRCIIVWGSSGGTNRGGEGGHRFVGFRDFCVDAPPASSPLSRLRTPTTHLTWFSDRRRSQLSFFSTSGGAGVSGGYELGGRRGDRFIESPDYPAIMDTLFVHKTLPVGNHAIWPHPGLSRLCDFTHPMTVTLCVTYDAERAYPQKI